VQLLLRQGMPVAAVFQFHTHWTNVSSTLGDDEPALLTIHTLVDASTYFEQDCLLNLCSEMQKHWD
jgi:hypothetical protein